MKKNNKGFSVIIAMLIVAFLIVVSSGVLSLVLEELKNTRMVYNSIVTYEAAIGANEYALIKIKNHSEGFQDKITTNDIDSSILNSSASLPKMKQVNIFYDIESYGNSYTGNILKGSFDVIPLFYDSGSLMQVKSKNPNGPSNIIKTLDFSINSGGDYVWNIIGNNSSGTTYGISGTGGAGTAINELTQGFIKKVVDDTNFDTSDGIKKVVFSGSSIDEFLGDYENSYLILYNSNNTELGYTMASTSGFSFPKIKVVGTGKAQNYVTNIEIKEDRSRYFEALMYNLFSK